MAINQHYYCLGLCVIWKLAVKPDVSKIYIKSRLPISVDEFGSQVTGYLLGLWLDNLGREPMPMLNA